MTIWQKVDVWEMEKGGTEDASGFGGDTAKCYEVCLTNGGSDVREETITAAYVFLTLSGDVGVIYTEGAGSNLTAARREATALVAKLSEEAKNCTCGTDSITFAVTNHDVDNIMKLAIHGGITEWCSHVGPVGNCEGETLYEQISCGGKLFLYSRHVALKWKLGLDEVLRGVKLWMAKNMEQGRSVCLAELTERDADVIIQFALFGEPR